MDDVFMFVITLLIFLGVGCFILGILLFQNIQRAYDRLNTHTYSIVNTAFPEWTLRSNEAVFEYNPVSSPPSRIPIGHILHFVNNQAIRINISKHIP